MSSRIRFDVPPYDVVFSVGSDEAESIANGNRDVHFVPQGGMVVARLSGSRENAKEFATAVKSRHHLVGWIVPVAYRVSRISEDDAQARAAAELRLIESASPELAFSVLRPTITLGNPMTWAFVTEVHSRTQPDVVWRRHIEIDRVTGGLWDERTYAEYRMQLQDAEAT